jgi:DNA polymerase elongation subunit (family B)
MPNLHGFQTENLESILFIDIETVSQHADFGGLSDEWKELWALKAEAMMRNRDGESPESLYPRAAIYAEFGKIVCIGCGVIRGAGMSRRMVIKSFSSDDEQSVLTQFAEMLNRWGSEPNRVLCAHNGKEFDFPYLCRRMIIHGISLPRLLQIAGRKPWEVPHLDTMEMWKFGDFRSYTSLNLMAHALGIPTPKDDLDGSKVGEAYWVDGDLGRIARYCEKDVLTAAQVFLRLIGEPAIPLEHVEHKTS